MFPAGGSRCTLGATGHGHGSVRAVVLGLGGERPELVDPVAAGPRLEDVRRIGTLSLAGEHPIAAFAVDDDVVLHRRKRLDFHTNGMLFRAVDAEGVELDRREYCSVGGGFVLVEDAAGNRVLVEDATPMPYRSARPRSCWRTRAGPGCGSATSCSPTSSAGGARRRSARVCCTSGR